MIAKNEKLWKDKMGKAMSEFKSKLEKVENKYKGDMKKSDDQH